MQNLLDKKTPICVDGCLLDLSGHGLTSLEGLSNLFENLPEIRYLWLNKNHLTNDCFDILKQFPNLIEISLQCNNITDTPPSSFDPLSSIVNLYLRDNQIKKNS